MVWIWAQGCILYPINMVNSNLSWLKVKFVCFFETKIHEKLMIYINNVNRLWKIWVGGRGRFQRLVLFQLVSLFNVRWIEWWGVNKLFTVCSGNCGCRSSGANTCIGCGNLPHSQYGSSQEGVVMVLPLKLASASSSAINTFFSSLFSQHNTHFGFLTLYDWLPKSSLILLNVLLLSNGKISTSSMSWCYYFIASPHFLTPICFPIL